MNIEIIKIIEKKYVSVVNMIRKKSMKGNNKYRKNNVIYLSTYLNT